MEKENILINLISEKTKEILKKDNCIIAEKFTEYKRYIREFKEFENIADTQDFIYLIKKHLYKNYSFFYDRLIKKRIFFDYIYQCQYLITHREKEINEAVYKYSYSIIDTIKELEKNKNIVVEKVTNKYICFLYKNKKIKLKYKKELEYKDIIHLLNRKYRNKQKRL